MAELVLDAPTLRAPGVIGIIYLAGSTAAVGVRLPWQTPPRKCTAGSRSEQVFGSAHVQLRLDRGQVIQYATHLKANNRS
jgi:hypothetical protein